jgi:hypothetical protein
VILYVYGGDLQRGFEQIEKFIEVAGERRMRKIIQFYHHRF